MIIVDLTPKGSVGVRATDGRDRAFLDRIPYLVRKGSLNLTWWTYLGDLRRDLKKRKTKWTPRVGKNLRGLLKGCESTSRGKDSEGAKCFAKQPYGFRMEGIHFGVNVERCLIADSTGLGKTIQAMGIMFVGMQRGSIRRAIIMCPAGLKLQWFEELHDFSTNDLNVKIAQPGSKVKRARLYKSDWDVLLINPKLFLNDLAQIKALRDVDFIAVDEASIIRNPGTQIAQAVKKTFKKTRFRIALTATPLENRLRDLFSVFGFVDGKVFISQEYFDKRYVLWKTVTFMVKKRNGRKVQVSKLQPKEYKNLGEVKTKIKGRYIRRRVSDVGLELPGLVVQWEMLDMPPRQREVYKTIREATLKKIKKLRGAALMQPLQGLRQACNSTSLVRKKRMKRPGQVKVGRLKELLDTELSGEQVLIFTDYERFVRLLMKALVQFNPASYTGKMGRKERQRSMDAFKVGDKRLLIMTKAGERGHNLQNAGIVINADLPYNPAAIKQRLGRVRRFKSKHSTVRMINMVCKNTIEESLIMRKIYSRRLTFESVFGDDELTKADPLGSMLGEDMRHLV